MGSLSAVYCLDTVSSLDDAVLKYVGSVSSKTTPQDYQRFAKALSEEMASLDTSDTSTVTNPNNVSKLIELDQKLLDQSPQTAQKLYKACINILLPDYRIKAKELAKMRNVLSNWPILEWMLYAFHEATNFYFRKEVDVHSQSQAVVLKLLQGYQGRALFEFSLERIYQIASLPGISAANLKGQLVKMGPDNLDKLISHVLYAEWTPEQKGLYFTASALLGPNITIQNEELEKLIKECTPANDPKLGQDMLNIFAQLPEKERTMQNLNKLKEQLSKWQDRSLGMEAFQLIPQDRLTLDLAEKMIVLFSKTFTEEKAKKFVESLKALITDIARMGLINTTVKNIKTSSDWNFF